MVPLQGTDARGSVTQGVALGCLVWPRWGREPLLIVDLLAGHLWLPGLRHGLFARRGSGEIDKDSTPKHTHWTDGLIYYIADRYPIAGVQKSIRVGGFS
ncbi:MAG: hypothetical protein GY807_06710 [Gammaproteobacteria bacterium]|nr:hypothetical protein [Gammaproteobacteria bacterium]